jgi:hypothetical protein
VTEPGATVRALFFVLITGLVALFVLLAVDTVVPNVPDPYAAYDVSNPAFDSRLVEIDEQLSSGAITQEQADAAYEAAAVEFDRASGMNEPSEAEMSAYDIASQRRNLTVSGADLVASALLLGAGVFLRRRRSDLAAIALLAGPVVGLVGGLFSVGSSQAWQRVGMVGVAAALALGAGLVAFRELPVSPVEAPTDFEI